MTAYEYTDWVDWHPELVYKTEASPTTAATLNHEVDWTGTQSCTLGSSSHGFGLFIEPFPNWEASGSDAESAWDCCVTHASVGSRVGGVGVEWDGLCPISGDPPATGSVDGSRYDGGYEDSPGPNTADASCIISGWDLRPWRIYSDYDVTMDDPTLEDEFNAALDSTFPGSEWTVEVEAFHPFFQGFEVAPDEDTALTQPYDTIVPVTWLYDPPTAFPAWTYQGYQYDGDTPVPAWGYGGPTAGTDLCSYSGGLEEWVSVPDAWQPTQSADRFVCEFVEPDDAYLSAIPLTLAAGYDTLNNITSGRRFQLLAIRAAWKTPRLRWRRETTGIPPLRILQRSDAATTGAARVIGGGNTRQRGNRTIGSIL